MCLKNEGFKAYRLDEKSICVNGAIVAMILRLAELVSALEGGGDTMVNFSSYRILTACVLVWPAIREMSCDVEIR